MTIRQEEMNLAISRQRISFETFYSLHVGPIIRDNIYRFIGYIPEAGDIFLVRQIIQDLRILLNRGQLLLSIFPVIPTIEIPRNIREWYIPGTSQIDTDILDNLIIETTRQLRTRHLPILHNRSFERDHQMEFILSYHDKITEIDFYSVHRRFVGDDIYDFIGYIPDLTDMKEYPLSYFIDDLRIVFNRGLFHILRLPETIHEWYIPRTQKINKEKYKDIIYHIERNILWTN